MILNDYISNLNERYRLGNATEHTFRSDFQVLIESMVPDIRATNEPKNGLKTVKGASWNLRIFCIIRKLLWHWQRRRGLWGK